MLSKEEAFQICMELWQYMEKIPLEYLKDVGDVDSLKCKWKGWEEYGYMESDCPCCQYNIENDEKCCGENCLLSSIWKNGCGNKFSPYIKLIGILAFYHTRGVFCIDDWKKNCRIIWKECERQLKILKEA